MYSVKQWNKLDELTGCLNRVSFIRALESKIEQQPYGKNGLAILAVDVDEFKEVNDSLGYVIGDEILRILSMRIKEVITPEMMIARFSGDDFFITIDYSDMNAITRYAQEISRVCSNPIVFQDKVVHIKINIGVCFIPEQARDVQSALRYTNIAVYQAKEKGNDRICFYSEKMSDELEENFFVANYLVDAVNKRELHMCYQPIIDLASGKVKGIEALMRWVNKDLGNVPPDKFIKVAEKTGQIHVIGDWGFDEVCKQMKKWQKKGMKNIHVSVNVSIKQLENKNFANRCIQIMKKHDIPAKYIELEITESVSSGDLDTIVSNLKIFKEFGCTVAMDDFGTGFSSLGQFEVFELDKLKIDKIFIHGMVSDLKKQKLVKAIIAMASSLNLSVVAEGIEDERQLQFLQNMGCEYGQGYLFSKPLQKEMFEEYYWEMCF